jgi:hypothetical protein
VSAKEVGGALAFVPAEVAAEPSVVVRQTADFADHTRAGEELAEDGRVAGSQAGMVDTDRRRSAGHSARSLAARECLGWAVSGRDP